MSRVRSDWQVYEEHAACHRLQPERAVVREHRRLVRELRRRGLRHRHRGDELDRRSRLLPWGGDRRPWGEVIVLGTDPRDVQVHADRRWAFGLAVRAGRGVVLIDPGPTAVAALGLLVANWRKGTEAVLLTRRDNAVVDAGLRSLRAAGYRGPSYGPESSGGAVHALGMSWYAAPVRHLPMERTVAWLGLCSDRHLVVAPHAADLPTLARLNPRAFQLLLVGATQTCDPRAERFGRLGPGQLMEMAEYWTPIVVCSPAADPWTSTVRWCETGDRIAM